MLRDPETFSAELKEASDEAVRLDLALRAVATAAALACAALLSAASDTDKPIAASASLACVLISSSTRTCNIEE